MKRLAERMQAQTMRVIRASGLPIQPSNVLTLAILNERGPQTVSDIAAFLKLAQPTVTRAVAGLVNEGVVTLDRGEGDQRQRLVSLTSYGRDIWQRAEKEVWLPLEEAVDAMLAGMNCDLLGGLVEVEREIARKPMDQRVRERKTHHPTSDRDV
jgi:DNA-binding MarR family transcriptional regulator